MVEAFHGSRHEFDAFSLEKVGAGEGNQSYGHGLYFAESEGVADNYKLAGDPAAREARRKNNLAKLRGEPVTEEAPQGNRYRVKINVDKEALLDWDKDLMDQPAGKAALERIDPAFRETLDSYLDEHGQAALDDLNGMQLQRLLERFATEDMLPGVESDGSNPRKDASDYLKSLGIPGIKYLDQGSRANAGYIRDIREFGESNIRDTQVLETKLREKEELIAAKPDDDMLRATVKGMDREITQLQNKIAEREQRIGEMQRILDEESTSNFVIFDDSLIEITHKNNEAVQAVRRSAGLEHPLADLYGAEDFVYGENITAKIKPKELYTAHELELEAAVKEEMDRILPKGGLEIQSAHEITMDGESPQGVHMMFDKRMPLALYSLVAEDPIGIKRHEIMHHLRGMGFWSPSEWSTLAYAAVEQGWIKKYDINARYPRLSSVGKIEEAVAEAFREWRRVGDKGLPTPERALFRKMEIVVRAIQRAFAKAFGKEKAPTWEELFDRVDEGEIGSREGTKPIVEGAKASQEEPTLTSQIKNIHNERTAAAEAEIAKLEQEHDKLVDVASKGSNEAEAKAKQAGVTVNSSSDLLQFMSPEAIAAHKRIREIGNEIRKKSAEANYDRVLQILPEGFTAVRDIQKNDWGGAEWAKAVGTEDQHVIGIHNKEGSLVGNLSGFLHHEKWFEDFLKNPSQESVHERAMRAAEEASQNDGNVTDLAFEKQRPELQDIANNIDQSTKRTPGEATVQSIHRVKASASQGELDVTRMEDKAVFDKAAAIGMTVDQYRRYMNLIESRRIEDMEADLKRATKAEERRQSKEWKENKAGLRTEVAEQMAQRPDIQALRFVEDKKINLTPETANSLAEYFGYQTGAEMIERVKALQEQRKASGLNSYEFTRRLIDVETDRRMEQRYGDLGENILKEAKDQVLSETQLDLLHEETLALAEQARVQLPIPQKELRAQIVEGVQKMELKNLSSDHLLEAAGRAGRDMEMAHLKGDIQEAFRQKQRQFIAVAMAKEAMKIEADAAKLDKLAKKYEGRDLPKIDPATAAYTQQLLQQAGYKVKLMPQEIEREIAAHGHGSLGDYVQHLVDFGWEPELSENILSRGGKPLEQAKVSEFYELKDAADSLDFIGRNQMKIDLAGEKMDYKDWKETTLEKIRSRPVRDITKAEAGGKEGSWLYRLDAPLTRMEEIVKDLDLREELGPLYKALIVPFELSKAKSYNMLNELSKEIKSINGFNKKWRRSLEDNIPNDFVYDTYNETLFKLNRWNMVKMMLNWGNESNALKMIDGIARAGGEVKPSKEFLNYIHARLEDMFAQHATPEDWNFVKKIWSVFDGYKGEVETMNRNLGGKIPKWIEGREIQTPDGPITGGYFPLIPDKRRNLGPMAEGKKITGTGPMSEDYFRATTNQKYLEQRTGARYFVDITNGPEQLIGRLQQVIHDISYRDFVKTAGQVIYDKEIMAAITKHYGPEYAAQMVPWLKRIANQVTVNEAELQGFNDILGAARLNLVAAALPLNYTVMLSPSMGTLNLKQMALFNADRTANKALVMENSKEIQHMLYSLDRDVNQALRTQLGKQGWTAFQLKSMEWMFWGLIKAEQEFRMTTFYGEFMKQKGLGKSDFDAGLISDSLIRERHGSQHVGDLPALMASNNEFVKMSTVFMGYFSTQRNWMRQIPGQVRAGDMSGVAKTLWGTMGVATIMNALLFTKTHEDESMLPWEKGFFKWASRAVLSTPLQMIPFVRDAWNYATEGMQPTSPIVGLMTSVYETIKDGVKLAEGGQPKNPIKHGMNTLGAVFGVPGAMQAGRTGEFLKDVVTKEQRPRGIVEWMRGLATGEAKRKK